MYITQIQVCCDVQQKIVRQIAESSRGFRLARGPLLRRCRFLIQHPITDRCCCGFDLLRLQVGFPVYDHSCGRVCPFEDGGGKWWNQGSTSQSLFVDLFDSHLVNTNFLGNFEVGTIIVDAGSVLGYIFFFTFIIYLHHVHLLFWASSNR